MALACALAVGVPSARAQGDAPTTITVEGKVLTGPYAFAERRAGRLYLPLGTIAEALGDRVAVDLATRTVHVSRRSGVVTSLNVATGQVFENNVPILVSTGAGDIPVTSDPRALLVPVELVSALLDVAVVIDAPANTLRISREPAQVTVSTGEEHGLFDLYQARYGYNATLSPNDYNHNVQLEATGRAFDGLLSGNANFAGDLRSSPFDLRYGLITFDRPDGQRVMLGDVSSGGDLAFLSSAMRGGWYRQPISRVDVTTFAGMARSGAAPDPLATDVLPSLNFDTPLVGAYLTLGRQRTPGAEQHVTSSTGGMWFNGPNRRAGVASTSLRYATSLHTFQAELGLGSFEERLSTGETRSATGLLVDITEALTPVEAVSIVAGFTHVDEGYLGPQSGTALRPMNLVSGGVNWRITDWFSTSWGGRYQERLDRPGRPVDYDVTGTAALNPKGWPLIIANHSEGVGTDSGPRSITLVNVSHLFAGVNLFANFTRMAIGENPLQLSGTVGASTRIGDLLTLSAFQTFNRSGGVSGGLDMVMPSFFTQAVTVSAGIGYNYSETSGLNGIARLTVAARLPGKHSLQLNVNQTAVGPQGLLDVSGPIYERPGGAATARLPVKQLTSVGSFSGRIFQDVDLDGVFDPAKDRPLPEVQVLIDGSNAVFTDADGQYRIGNIQAGAHSVYLNLLTVRADLSLLTTAKQQVELLADRDGVVDFRLVRTGRLSGVVWLDANLNGTFDEGELPLSEIRVIAGKRDTLTNSKGEFLLGDLPQGTHLVVLDEKTLPNGVVPASGSVEVQVKPPKETRNVMLPTREQPREIEIQQF